MLTVENIETVGWRPALRGMRNPLNSWDRADSDVLVRVDEFDDGPDALGRCHVSVEVGPNDEYLMRRLIGQGSPDHCKFRRMLAIYCDVTAPLYWWNQADTYAVGTVKNSCSKMNTIMGKPFTEDLFSFENVGDRQWIGRTLEALNDARDRYLQAKVDGDEAKAKGYWDVVIQMLPESWNQRRTFELNYEVMANIYKSRRHHKLQEWHDFIDAMVESLPYPWIFTGEGC